MIEKKYALKRTYFGQSWYIWHSSHLIIIVKIHSPAEESDETVGVSYTTKKTGLSIFKIKMYFNIKRHNQFRIWHLFKRLPN